MPHVVFADIEVEFTLTVGAEVESPDKSVGEVGPQIFPDRVDGLSYSRTESFPVEDEHGCQIGVSTRIIETIDLLDGVNLRSPDIRKLFANILALYSAEAEDAIREQL